MKVKICSMINAVYACKIIKRITNEGIIAIYKPTSKLSVS